MSLMCIYPSRIFQCHRSHLGDLKLVEVVDVKKLEVVYNGLSGNGKKKEAARKLGG